MNFIDLFYFWLMTFAPTAPVESNPPVAPAHTVQAPAAQPTAPAGRVRIVRQEPARISNGF